MKLCLHTWRKVHNTSRLSGHSSANYIYLFSITLVDFISAVFDNMRLISAETPYLFSNLVFIRRLTLFSKNLL